MAKKPIVWVIDDDDSIRWVLEKGLTEDNLEVVTFDRANKAIKRLETDSPDVILTDIKMPGASGIQLLDFIKENKLKNLIIAGESIGGVLSATTAIKLPKIVNKVFLFNPYDYDNYFGEGISRANLFAKIILFNISLPVVGSFFSSLENKIILKNILKGGFFNIKCLSNEYLNLLCSSIKKNGYTYHFRNVLKNYKSWTESKKLYNKIKIPVKLIYGDNDWANNNNKNDTKDSLGLASYNIIKDCGHFSFLENPKVVAKILSS